MEELLKTVTIGDVIKIVSIVAVLAIAYVRLGPRVDNLEKYVQSNEKWKGTHEDWADIQVKKHTDLEVAMTKLASSQADMSDWLKKTDERLINHLTKQWDGKDRRNV